MKLTYANVMATIAVFIALGGTSYAALTISGNQIKNRSIPAVKIKRGALTSKEVRSARVSTRTRQLYVSKPRRKARASSTSGPDLTSSIVKLSVGETKTVLAAGPFQVLAKCVYNSSINSPSTAMLATSDEPGTLTDAWFDENGRINPGETSVLARATESGTINISPERATFIAPDGQTLQVRYIYGQNALGADCFASAFAVG